jgi:hypothetical protein
MGIYTNGSIFGIMMYTVGSDTDDTIVTLFTKQYDMILSDEEREEAYTFYTELIDKNDICFKFYTECTSTHDLKNKNYMIWHPMTLKQFLEIFNI